MFSIEFIFKNEETLRFSGVPGYLVQKYVERSTLDLWNNKYHMLFSCESVNDAIYIIENIFGSIKAEDRQKLEEKKKWVLARVNHYAEWRNDFVYINFDDFGIFYVFKTEKKYVQH